MLLLRHLLRGYNWAASQHSRIEVAFDEFRLPLAKLRVNRMETP